MGSLRRKIGPTYGMCHVVEGVVAPGGRRIGRQVVALVGSVGVAHTHAYIHGAAEHGRLHRAEVLVDVPGAVVRGGEGLQRNESINYLTLVHLNAF